jgi:nucleoside-diphosphate-sugar epimerase
LFRPAINGTTSVLRAAQKNNPNVKRIVITSSFAANLDPTKGVRPGFTYTDSDWNPVTREAANASGDGVFAYVASKTFAEQAAWDYIEKEKVRSQLVLSLRIETKASRTSRNSQSLLSLLPWCTVQLSIMSKT